MLVAIAFAAFSFTTILVENYSADVTKSEINWSAQKVTGSHAGNITLKDGNLEFTDGVLSGGNFTVDMASLAVTDLEGKMKGKLEGHLKSEDFFGVEKFPTASFTITKVSAKGTPGDYKVTGDITVKGTTKEIKFYAHVEDEGSNKVATADIVLDRTDFDVRYGSGSFFSGLGDKTIYDDFELSVKLVSAK